MNGLDGSVETDGGRDDTGPGSDTSDGPFGRALAWVLLYGDLAFIVALSPYVVLSSYMLRILTVSRHSLETTVFTLGSEDEPTLGE